MFAAITAASLFLALLRPNPVAASVLINEVLPNPDDTVEAIELIFVPDNDESEINLDSWTISDRLAIIYTFSSEVLTEGEFLVKTFYNKLLNTGDSVVIKDKDGVIVDEFHYTNSQKGLSYSRLSHDQDIFILTSPSIGEANQIVLTPTPSDSDNNESPDETNTQENSQTAPSQPDSNLPDKAEVQSTAPTTKKTAQETKTAQHLPTETTPDQQLLIDKINATEEYLLLQMKNKPWLVQEGHRSEFITTVKFQTETISPLGVLSVIIGGLLFFISSRLIYEP